MTLPVPHPAVLVIDDDQELLAAVRQHLEEWGYRALTAPSAEEGLALAQAQRPALILLDIMMPKMRGREACAHLKAHPATAKIPVLFLSALGLPDHIRAGLEAGADDYLVKPFRMPELQRRIEVCLLRAGIDPGAA